MSPKKPVMPTILANISAVSGNHCPARNFSVLKMCWLSGHASQQTI
jgi:hypothetical protein